MEQALKTLRPWLNNPIRVPYSAPFLFRVHAGHRGDRKIDSSMDGLRSSKIACAGLRNRCVEWGRLRACRKLAGFRHSGWQLGIHIDNPWRKHNDAHHDRQPDGLGHCLVPFHEKSRANVEILSPRNVSARSLECRGRDACIWRPADGLDRECARRNQRSVDGNWNYATHYLVPCNSVGIMDDKLATPSQPP